MENNGDCRGDSHFNTHHVASSDNYAVKKIVNSVTQNYHVAYRFYSTFFFVGFTFVIFTSLSRFNMTMSPVDEFFKHKKIIIPRRIKAEITEPEIPLSNTSGIKCTKASPKSAPTEKLTRTKIILFRILSFTERKKSPVNEMRLTIRTLTPL